MNVSGSLTQTMALELAPRDPRLEFPCRVLVLCCGRENVQPQGTRV